MGFSSCKRNRNRNRDRLLSPTLLASGLAALAVTSACASVPQPRRIARQLQPGPVNAVDVRLDLSSGDLSVRGGACGLVHTDLQYDAARTRTRVRYHVREDRGTLVVEEDRESARRGTVPTSWNLCLGHTTPYDSILVDLGAGNSTLALAGLNVRALNVDVGAGNTEIDLRGPRPVPVAVSIDGGAGNITVRVPRNTGVRVHADKGVGSVDAPGFTVAGKVFTNAAHRAGAGTPAPIDIDVDLGAGNIRVIEG